MNDTTVFSRTVLGTEEIATNTRGLDVKLRGVLMLVDGRSTVAVLRKKVGMFNVADNPLDPESLLRLLKEQGLIEDVSQADQPAPESVSSPGPGDPGLKPKLIELIDSIVGAAQSEKLVKKINAAAETPEALFDAVNSCVRMVKLTIDESKATTLEARAKQLLSR